MAVNFHNLKVKSIKRETKDAITIEFDIPNDLQSVFYYKPGQYLTLRINHQGRDERRAYSISSSPLENKLTVSVKEVKDGFVSSYLNNLLKENDELPVMTPLGNFLCEPYERNERCVVLIAGGSGITPIFSILKSLLKVEKNTKVYLLYANQNEDSVMFKNEILDLNNQFPNFNLDLVYSKPNSGQPKRITKEYLDNFIKSNIDTNHFKFASYYICGPSGLNDTCIEELASLGIEKSRIHKESFVQAEKKIDENPKTEEITPSEISSIKVRLYGEDTEISISPDETILVAGMRASLDPPFSCQIGACSTCRAKLISGKVRMDDYDALTDNEIEQGYILTCTAHPITQDVFVDYDD
jgi:ring-1,2-phenylacetyl-CoA epoxidase subunit PaaE